MYNSKHNRATTSLSFVEYSSLKKRRRILCFPIANKIAFNQINRKVIINIESMDKMSNWFNSRLKIRIVAPMENDFTVSRERVKTFKQWLAK